MKKLIFAFILLLLLIPVVLIYFKGGFSARNNNAVNINNSSSTTTSSSKSFDFAKDGFLNPDNVAFPGNANFIKAKSSEDLGKTALYYDYNPYPLSGTEWAYTKKVNNEQEYKNALQIFDGFYNAQVQKNGWNNELTVESHNVQPIAADSPAGHLYGYIKYVNGNIQEILLYDQKDSLQYPTNVQFRVFLSDVKALKDVVK